ncbi:MAG: hypothetical protein FJX25_06370 [Alphaproteobacteria bacterium]|nr:hypothetical protein [Alphaproteobacteria bacterium]
MQPKFFQIGFNKCGTTFIAQLFDMNGIPAAHWLEGALAEDIAYARLTGRKPLERWAERTVAFTDMESVRFLNMPVIEAFKEYAFLDQHYPGSVFLLNTRRLEDWIASRYLHRGGAYARSYAANLGVPLGDLADIWAADWQAHLKGCRAHFGNRREFIQIDIDAAGPDDYRDALAPWFDLPLCPPMPGASVRKARQGNLPRVMQMIETPPPGVDIPADRRERLADRLARLAAPAQRRQKGRVDDPPTAEALCLDVARGQLRGGDGAVMPMTRGPGGRFYLEAQRPGLLRVAAVANDIAAVTDHGCYWLDMRPACFAGSDSDSPAAGPLIATLRRVGARNVFLWPAPWLHRIGNDGFPGAPVGDDPAFGVRADLAVWRGRLSGFVPDPDGPAEGDTAEAALAALSQMPAAEAPASDAARLLSRTARWQFLQHHAGAEGLDLALLPDDRAARALGRAGLQAPVPVRAAAPAARHVICLGGTAGDEDFLPLAQT